PSIEGLTPLRDQYIASSHRVRKAAASLPEATVALEIGATYEVLLAFGEGADDLFEARRSELAAYSESSRLAAESQTMAVALARQVQWSVRVAEQSTAGAVHAAQMAITRSQALLIFLVALSLGSAFVFAWIYVGRGLLSRLSKLNEAILALARGDLKITVP